MKQQTTDYVHNLKEIVQNYVNTKHCPHCDINDWTLPKELNTIDNNYITCSACGWVETMTQEQMTKI